VPAGRPRRLTARGLVAASTALARPAPKRRPAARRRLATEGGA